MDDLWDRLKVFPPIGVQMVRTAFRQAGFSKSAWNYVDDLGHGTRCYRVYAFRNGYRQPHVELSDVMSLETIQSLCRDIVRRGSNG